MNLHHLNYVLENLVYLMAHLLISTRFLQFLKYIFPHLVIKNYLNFLILFNYFIVMSVLLVLVLLLLKTHPLLNKYVMTLIRLNRENLLTMLIIHQDSPWNSPSNLTSSIKFL